MNIIEQGARSIGGISDMGLAARETPNEKWINRAKAQFPPLGPFPRAFHMVQNPRNLGAGEVWIKQQAGSFTELLFVALRL